MSELTTARLKLRHWSPADLAPFATMNADPAVMQFMPARLSPQASDAFAATAQAHLDREGFGLWAVEVRGGPRFIGYVGLQAPSFAAPLNAVSAPAALRSTVNTGCTRRRMSSPR